jgi:hypothetical protein
MRRTRVIEVLGNVAHELLHNRCDSRLLLMDRYAEDRSSSPRDENHQNGNDARHERSECPDSSSTEYSFKQHFEHPFSVEGDADRLR